MKKLVFLCLCIATTFLCHALGLKISKVYPMPLLSEAMVWDIDTKQEGWTYLATNDGLIQFEGSDPELFQLKNRRAARSVYIDQYKNRIYIGGINEFGYFVASPTTSLEYVCLSDSIGSDKFIGNIWGVYPSDDILVVQGDQSIITYDLNSGKHSIINTSDKLDGSAMIDGVLWLATDNGLKFLMGKSIVDAPGAEKLKDKRIREILPYKDSILVVCSDGIWEYKNQSLKKLSQLDAAIMGWGEIFSADIKDDILALGSVDKGMSLININTGDFNIYNDDNGLPSNTVVSLKFNNIGDLWLGLQFGLAKLLMTFPVEKLDNNVIPVGSGFVLNRKEDKLYLGTNRGLFKMDYNPIDLLHSKQSLQLIEGLRGQVWNLQDIDGELFVSHDRGLFSISPSGKINRIGNIAGVWDIQRMIGSQDKAYVGTYNGVSILRRQNGKWEDEKHLEGYSSSLFNFVQESPCIIWNDNAESGVDRLIIDTLNNKVKEVQTFLETDDGYPLVSELFLCRIDNEVLFATPHGIYKYDKDEGKIIRDKEISSLLHNPKYVRRIKKTGGSIYALTDHELLQADPAGILDMRRIPMSQSVATPMHDRDLFFPVGGDYIGYPIKDGYLFYDYSPSTDSLVIYNPDVRINRVLITNDGDSVIYRGNFDGLKIEPRLRHDENSIRIEFGNEDGMRNGALFSTRLNNEQWSVPISSTSKEYTHLKSGKYKFEVKSITPDGKEAVDSIVFRISPPWWRTGWMEVIYLVFGLAIIFFLIRLEQERISKKQNKLLKEKNDELVRNQEAHRKETEAKDRQIMELEREKIEKELRHKAQEVANVMISLSSKNETLQTVKQELHEIMGMVPKSNTDLRRAILNLQGKVTVDIKKDDVLKRVEEEFDIAHDNFMKKLRSSYPDLNNNEVLLCAYIKMNLSTKEIAPMMNISVRGIETMRYRLRKKLGLEREDNLTEFLSREI